MADKSRFTPERRTPAENAQIASRPALSSPHLEPVSHALRFTLYRGRSRRLKGMGREAVQYEGYVEIGQLVIEPFLTILPDGVTIHGKSDLVWARTDSFRAGWVARYEDAQRIGDNQAALRDSVPVRNLRKLAMKAGHNGNGVHRLLEVSVRNVADWRTGRTEMPADMAAKIAALLQEVGS